MLRCLPGLVNKLTVCELENGPVEIVDLRIKMIPSGNLT